MTRGARSIRARLARIQLATAAILLLVVGTGMMSYEFVAFRNDLIRKSRALSLIIGSNSTAALVFHDSKTAAEVLSALRAEPNVRLACVYDQAGAVFATYSASGTMPVCPPAQDTEWVYSSMSAIRLFSPIILDRERVGSVCIESSVAELRRQLQLSLTTLLMVSGLATLLSLFASSRLQRVVSAPIVDLARVASSISVTGDYTVRAALTGEGEVGQLVVAFNEMLEQLQQRGQENALLLSHERASREEAERATRALSESEERLRLAQDAAKAGTWEWNLRTNENLWSEGACRLFGVEPQSVQPSYEAWLATIHPEERAQAERVVQEAARSGTELNVEWRVLTRDGTSRWLMSRGRPVRDASGQVVRYRGIAMDITDRKRAEEALLREDRRKSEFIAVLSHELRNPLAAICASLEVLRRTLPETAVAARAGEIVERQAKHMTRLVNDLLDVTRISRGKIEIKRARVDLREVVRASCDDLRSLFERGGVEVRLELPADPIWADADATRLSQAVGNLLHNAAKFTPAGGNVTLGVTAGGGRAEVSVRDTGVGMEPGELEGMFEPFAQAVQGLARTQGGLGLGLPLAKGLVELHGGSIRARSEGAGRGSEFVISLPLA